MNYLKLRKHYAKTQSDLESELLTKLISGEVKAGDQEYKRLCEEIENAASLASQYATRYDENN